MRYDFHPEARLEYREAAVFYEARRPGLGRPRRSVLSSASLSASLHFAAKLT